jgi:curved DNA-binding protein CbpA
VPSPYDLLDVERGATPTELRAAYKRKAFQLHPDRHGGSPEVVERFKKMQLAFEQLLEEAAALDARLPVRRAGWYDENGEYDGERTEEVRQQRTQRRTGHRATEAQDFDPLDMDAGDRIWSAYTDLFACQELYAAIDGTDGRGRGGW